MMGDERQVLDVYIMGRGIASSERITCIWRL